MNLKVHSLTFGQLDDPKAISKYLYNKNKKMYCRLHTTTSRLQTTVNDY